MSVLSKKASKGRFLKPEKLQNHSHEEKIMERRKIKSEEKRKKVMVALLVFVIATLEIGFGRKKLLDTIVWRYLAITLSKTMF